MKLVALLLSVAVALSGCGEPSKGPAPPKSATPSTVTSLKPPANALQYQSAITREATFVFGIAAPVPALAGQIEQESSWNCAVTARDGGMGCAQFMKATAGWLVQVYPELGAARPYDPVWAFQAQARLDKYNFDRVKGVDECNRWGAAFTAYNAGLGNVQHAQGLSPRPDVWWDATEKVVYKQSAANFKSSRDYPHRIIYTHQPRYALWGRTVCF